MKLSRKSLVLIVSVVLCAVMTIGGTMAYLTDTDAKVNTFTMGNVDIEVKENYIQGSVLLPGQKVDKHAWIENVGSQPAYVIMNVAVPAQRIDKFDNDGNSIEGEEEYIEVVSPQVIENVDQYWTLMDKEQHVVIEGKDYLLYSYLYNKVLEPANAENDEDQTVRLLNSITLNSGVDYDPINDCYVMVTMGNQQPVDADLVNGKVYVNGYAIQAEGFNTAEYAYAAYKQQWFNEEQEDKWSQNQILVPSIVVDNQTELKAAFAEAKAGQTITLRQTQEGEANFRLPAAIPAGVTVQGDGNVHVTVPQGEGLNRLYADGVTFRGLIFSENNDKLWTRGSVTFQNCTFNCEINNAEPAELVKFISCSFSKAVHFAPASAGATPVGQFIAEDCQFGGNLTIQGFEKASFRAVDFLGSNWAKTNMITYTPATFQDCRFHNGDCITNVEEEECWWHKDVTYTEGFTGGVRVAKGMDADDIEFINCNAYINVP